MRAAPWRDLVPVSRLEVARELLLPLPWLAGSLALAQHGLYAPALGLSFVFFLTGLRVVHNAYHAALAFDRFFHVEHHLYPRVPTCHLARLAERFDAAVPELRQKRVF